MSFQKFAVAQVLSAEIAPVDQGGLRRFAHRHHFDYTPRPGYLYVRSRAISSRCNDNFDEFPAEEIKKAYATFVGKPVFVNHRNEDHKRARGVIIDAALHEDTNPDGSPDTWAEVLMEVDAVRFPKLAEAVVKGEVDRTSMGTDVAFSRCSVCNNKASTPLEYCQHIPAMKGQRVYRTTASGHREGILVREICYGLGFFENSLLVEEPADPTAVTWGAELIPEVSPRTASLDVADQRRTYAEASSDAAARIARREQPTYLTDIGVGELGVGLGGPTQASAPSHHVGGVRPVGPQNPVRRVVAERNVAGVPNDLPGRDRTHQLGVTPPVGSDRRTASVRQGEAAVTGVEGAAGPRPAGVRSGRGIDLGQVAGHLGHADHGAYTTAASTPQPQFAENVMKTYRELGGKPGVDPSVAGVAVRAKDTGRLLMLQRSFADEKDPARGKWEMPGGHVEKDETPYQGAIREWEEETGQRFPDGEPDGIWHSPNGIYRGFLHSVPNEDVVPTNDINSRQVINPDDPDGDDTETLAWMHPNELKHNPAVRDEVRKGTNWDLLGATKHEKAAAVDHDDHGSLFDDDDFSNDVRNSSDWRDKSKPEQIHHLQSAHNLDYVDERADDHTLGVLHSMDHEDWGDDQHEPHTHGDAPAQLPPASAPAVGPAPGAWADKSDEDKRRHLAEQHGFKLPENSTSETLDSMHHGDHAEPDPKASAYITPHGHADTNPIEGTAGPKAPSWGGGKFDWKKFDWKKLPPACTHDPAKGCPHIPEGRAIPPNAVKYEPHSDEFWVKCDQGHRHYGEDGASGILVRHKGSDGQHRFLMQNRAGWTDHGGTWSVPGGAIGRNETPYSSSKREAEEEVGDLGDTKHAFTHTLDHGGWAYHTVVADVKRQPDFGFGVSSEADGHAWVKKNDIDTAAESKNFLHPGFREAWPQLRAKLFPKDKPFVLPENRVQLKKQPPAPPKKAIRSVAMLERHLAVRPAYEPGQGPDEEYANRPPARVAAPEGHSPDDEYHGSYEVVQHPDTGQFHTVDNAGRQIGHWAGHPTQPQAERSRDYIESRQQSKEKARGIAEKLWNGVADIFDPGGTPEGRASDRRSKQMSDLMMNYDAKHIEHEPDDPDFPDEPGDAYAVAKHPSGWQARDYGGANLHIYHAATGEDAHDLLTPEDSTEGGWGGVSHKAPGFGHAEMQAHLNNWVRDYGKDFSEHADPRIPRWQRRNGYTHPKESKIAGGPMGHGSGRTSRDGGHERTSCATCGKDIYRVGEGSAKHWQHDLDSGAGVPHQARPQEESVTKSASRELQQHLRTLHMVDEGLLAKRDPEYLHQLAHEYMAANPDDHDAWDGNVGGVNGRPTFHVHDGPQVLSQRLAYGEIKAPEDVDTLRDDSCPVCGDGDAFDGDECQICGFVAPPKMFQDPDLDAAKQMDLRKDVAAEEAGGNPAAPINPDDALGEQDPAMPGEDEPLDPSQLDANGQPIEGQIPGTMPGEDDEPLPDSEDDDPMDPNQIGAGGDVDPELADGSDGMAPADSGEPGYPGDATPDLVCPSCHAEFGASAPESVTMNNTGEQPDDSAMAGQGGDGMLEGDVCPSCGMGALMSVVSGQQQPQQQMPMVANLFAGV